ncbi:hypothetical protein FIBSPDRAFT_221481 [Athelia psychrophila]|uniref:Uncharacterized protein n=1 Tax=Athelia psychrophila TaxID=1759441 RepID=A0A165YZU2_9AGAM|nr:hypothetical protein FIBSPDRAFT_221481 [Fibularhizoctonia sp. CBS 109695]
MHWVLEQVCYTHFAFLFIHETECGSASPAPMPKPKPAPIKRASSSSSSSSSSSNSDSEDDAPLATLLGPKRPGSSASNLTPRGPQRPLIDINAILPGDRTGSIPSPLVANNAREREVADLSGLKKLAELKRKEELRLAKEEAEQRDAKVAAQQAQERNAERKAKTKPAQERDVETKSKAKPARAAPPNFSYPHRRTSSDVVTSPKEATVDLPPRPQSRGPEASLPSPAPTVSHLREPASSSRRKIVVSTVEPEPDSPQGISDDLMAALRFMDPDAYERSKIPAPAPPPAPASKGEKGKNLPIVPTPITRREAPPGFSVMSRPQHGQTHRTTQSSGAMSTLTTASVNSSATITPTNESAGPAVSSRDAVGSSKAGKTIAPPPRSSSLFILPTDGDSSFTSTSTTPSVSTSTSSRSRPDPASTRYFPTKQSISSLSSLASPTSSPEEPKVPLKVAPILKAPRSTGRPRSSTVTLISQIPETAPLNPDSRAPQASKPYIQPVSRPGTLVSMIPAPPSPTSSKASYKPKPFAAAMRRDSPASSTGDSSSGRYPITPRDGSEVGEDDEWLRQERRKREMRVKRRSVSHGSEADFDRLAAKSRVAPEQSDHTPEAEQRRKERRRGEAKAAIEVCLSVYCFKIPSTDSSLAGQCSSWARSHC